MKRNLLCLGLVLTVLTLIAPAAFAGECDFAPSAGRAPRSAAACAAGTTIGGPPRFDPTDMAMSPDGVLVTCASMTLNAPETVAINGFIDFRPGCDFAGDDFSTLYCMSFDVPGVLTAVDTASCEETTIGTASTSQSASGMAWDPSTSTMYLSTTDIVTSQLFTIDVGNASTNLIGNISDSPGNISIGFNKAGDLFGHDVITDGLHAIDKSNGVSNLLGPVGFDANFAQGMDFDAADDTCYIFGFNNGTFQPELWECNISDGSGTFVGVIGSIAPGGLQEWTGPGIMATNGGGCALTAKIGGTGISSGGMLPIDLHLLHARGRAVTRSFKITLENGAGQAVAQMRTPGVRMRAHQLIHKSYKLRVPTGTPAGEYQVRVVINGMEQGQVAAVVPVTLR